MHVMVELTVDFSNPANVAVLIAPDLLNVLTDFCLRL